MHAQNGSSLSFFLIRVLGKFEAGASGKFGEDFGDKKKGLEGVVVFFLLDGER